MMELLPDLPGTITGIKEARALIETHTPQYMLEQSVEGN